MNYLVKTKHNKYGIFYWKDKFVDKKCPVYILNEDGTQMKKATLCDVSYLTIIISTFKGKSKRIAKLPRI